MTDRQIILFNIWKNQISGGGEWPQGLRVILPLETVELHRRNTSPTAQKTTKSLQISYWSTYIYKNGADISLGLKHTETGHGIKKTRNNTIAAAKRTI